MIDREEKESADKGENTYHHEYGGKAETIGYKPTQGSGCRAAHIYQCPINAPFQTLFVFVYMAGKYRHPGGKGEGGKEPIDELDNIKMPGKVYGDI
jgi:hypothetical protein